MALNSCYCILREGPLSIQEKSKYLCSLTFTRVYVTPCKSVRTDEGDIYDNELDSIDVTSDEGGGLKDVDELDTQPWQMSV